MARNSETSRVGNCRTQAQVYGRGASRPRFLQIASSILMNPKASTGYAARETSRGAAEPRSLDRLAIDTIRTLAMDAVEKAKSGPPGTPMALVRGAYPRWQGFFRFD